MADRGRDLKIGVVSDVSRFTLDKPADQLDTLATAATRADRALDKIDIQDAVRHLDRFGDEAKDTARKVDDAFDAIARSSRAGTTKLGADVNTAKRKLAEVGDEAKDTAREALASFSSFGGDLADAGQEIAANAGALFGPVGLAIGGALSAGIALFKANAEELKATAQDILDDLLESGGQISQATISRRIEQMGMDVLRLRDIANDAKIPVADFLLAAAGDPGAIDRTNAALMASRDAYAATLSGSSNAAEMLEAFDVNARRVTDTLGRTTEATQLANDALRAITGAQSSAASSASAQEAAIAGVARAYREAERTLKDPIVAKLDIDTSAFYRGLAAARAAAKYAASERIMP